MNLPVLVGSGVNQMNLHAFLNDSNGIIVGSDFKESGKWYNNVEEKRVISFMEVVKHLRYSVLEKEEKEKKFGERS